MLTRNPSAVARYTFTILAVTLATLLRFALEPVLDLQVPFILYFPTVVLCAWFGGLRQGLLATALGGLIAWYVFIPPQYSFKFSDPTAPAQLIVFLFAGTLISLLAESLHRARKRTEESEAKEREQREQYHITLASIGDAVMATDAQGRVTFINPVAESLTGWTPKEASGQALEKVFHIVNEQTRQEVENPALRAIRDGVIVGLANHTLLIAKDGTERPIDDSGSPIKDAAGKTLGSVLIFRDISERRRVEKERALLADIVASSEDAIISKNLDGVVEAWNASAERLFEYTANEMQGQPITTIIPPEKIEEEQLILERLRRGERIEHFETVRRAKSGRTVDISLTVSPVRDATGRIIGASKIVRDITERKRAAEALQQQREWLRVTLSSIGDGVITTDTDGNITFLNPIAESLTGWNQEEAKGQPLPEVFHIVNEETRQTVENPALRAIREGTIVGLANHTVLIAKDGTEIFIDDSGAPIQDEGKTLGAVLIFRDISERRRAEKERTLLLEQARMIDSGFDAIIVRGAQDRITSWNRGAAALYGWSRDEALGQVTHSLFKTIFLKPLAEIIADLHRDNHWEGELIHTRKDGQQVTVLSRWVLERDAQGQPGSILETNMDITERKQAEDRFRLAVEASPAAKVMIDEEGRMMLVNSQTERLFGYTREELIGQPIEMLVPERFRHQHPEHRAGFARVPQARAMGAGRDLFGLRKDGHEVPIEIGLNPLQVNGKTLVLSSIVDITERKRAEEALRFSEQRARAFLDNSAIIAWLKDEAGRHVFLSDNYVRRFGLQDWENKTDFELWPREVATAFRENDLVVLGRHQPFECIEEARTPNGEVSYWLNSKFWFEDASGKKYVGGVGVDITERKQIEEERARLLQSAQAARATAEAANLAKDEFLAVVSHELRTPLNAILGWAKLLGSGQLDAPAVGHAIETIERSAVTQARLIEDLLDMSRIISGKLRLNYEPVNFVQTIEATLETVRPAAQAKLIQLKAELDSAADAVMGDTTRLQQVVWNLLSNAVKFTPKGGRVEVYLERSDSEAQLTVRDTGQGISSEFLPHVFERFQQADSKDTRQYGGLGLGLAIARHLVELHGGKITADSLGEGQGATFTVKLPLRAARAKTVELRETTVAEAQDLLNKLPTLDGLKVLVVDDEESTREIVTIVLEQCGAVVTAVTSAAEAFTTLARIQPDVLVSDIGMPGENGYELMSKIRKLTPEQGGNIPAVALTAYAKTEDRIRSLAAGFQTHVTKPVEPAELALVVASVAERAKMASQSES